MRFIKRYIEALKLRGPFWERLKVLHYITLAYALMLINQNLVSFPDFIKPEITLKSKTGKKMKLAKMRSSGQVHAFIELFLDDEYQLKNINQEPFVLIDFGANVGMFASGVKYFCGEIKYYFGVEPMKENLKILQEQATLLFENKNCFIFQGAVGKNRTTEEFVFDFGSSRNRMRNDEKRKTEKVQVFPFEEVVETFEKNAKEMQNAPAMFKMDIEGGEWEIIDSAIEYVKKRKNIMHLFFELHTINSEKTYCKIAENIKSRLADDFEFIETEENPKNIVLLGKRKKLYKKIKA